MTASGPESAQAAQARALLDAARAQDPDAALGTLGQLTDRFGEDDALDVAQIVAFAWLSRVNILVEQERFDEAQEDARGLLAVFERRPADGERAGFGMMLLDASLWLLAGERDATVLEITGQLIDAFAAGSPSEQAVAAGARFFSAQAAGRVGRMDESRAAIEALCEMGEPALAALNRIATQFGSEEVNPTWHAQIAATSVTVLWRLGRGEEARDLAAQAAARFAQLGQPQLQAMLSELEREIAPG